MTRGYLFCTDLTNTFPHILSPPPTRCGGELNEQVWAVGKKTSTWLIDSFVLLDSARTQPLCSEAQLAGLTVIYVSAHARSHTHPQKLAVHCAFGGL